MPTYNYKCNKCHHTFQQMRPIKNRDELPDCPRCNHESSRIFISPEGGFILKGHGWYKPGGFGGKGPKVGGTA